ncbi:DUF4402 domain-containing protein [Salegentibacter salegens]|uniref:DUF4402 domain-containing protein n=1 Tax=Salegentibacter salegens TaxID=143223 RepID=A0A1M7IXV1_9FLAO|nr:DUF4402 domain-containing protein [Salegentibacter salegens]PRX49846.1 uncharacterized protein DUF4402 [Salegentibacter salegens]SHM45473.1 protein of unknown function [Salegentibacter salegens]
MKKITFILLVSLISGTAFAQSSAEGTATVNAEIVSPIEINDGTDLDFGRIIGSSAGGSVTVSTDGDRTATTNDLLAPSTTVQAASFTVKAAEAYKYSITIPGIGLTGAGDDMPVTFESSLGNENVVGTGADQTLTVGGALTVNALQAEGEYSGTVTVTVAYE